MNHDDVHELQLEIDVLRQRVEQLESLVRLAIQLVPKRYAATPLFRKVWKGYAGINNSADSSRDLRDRTLVTQ